MSLSKDFSMHVCCVGCVNLPPFPPLLLLSSLSLPHPHEQAQKPQVLLGVFGMAPYSLIFKHILNFISL